MKLTPEAKASRERTRLLDKSHEMSAGRYMRKFVAPLFQRMIRAEFGADRRPYVTAVVDGVIRQVRRSVGECVCVTCGKGLSWDSGQQGMHTGHFIASRCNSILFEEANVAPQCCRCNIFGHGKPLEFRAWMIAVRGEAEVVRLERLRNEQRQFSREDLVDMRIGHAKRLKAAIELMS